jgi:hypothetical protein
MTCSTPGLSLAPIRDRCDDLGCVSAEAQKNRPSDGARIPNDDRLFSSATFARRSQTITLDLPRGLRSNAIISKSSPT